MELSIVAVCIDPAGPVFDRFLSSLRQYTECEHELIIIDNGGNDAARSADLAERCDRYIRFADRISLARAWNSGIAAATGSFVLVTNDDVVLPRGWFDFMKEDFERHPRAGMVAPVMNYALPVQTHTGRYSELHKAGAIRVKPFEEVVWGAFMLFTRESLAQVGGFSEEFEVASGEDLDMCFKLYEAGLEIYVDHRVFVYHEWGSTGRRTEGERGREDLYWSNYLQFKRKWHQYTKDWDKPRRGGGILRWWPFARDWARS